MRHMNKTKLLFSSDLGRTIYWEIMICMKKA